MNWTADQVTAAEKRIRESVVNPRTDIKPKIQTDEITLAARTLKALNPGGGMNRWEDIFRSVLELRRQVGEVQWYEFEPFRLKLATFTADGMLRTIWYTPDFAAKEAGETVFYEVKGHWREAARVRIKLAASKYPYRFVAVTREEGQWKYEEFRSC